LGARLLQKPRNTNLWRPPHVPRPVQPAHTMRRAAQQPRVCVWNAASGEFRAGRAQRPAPQWLVGSGHAAIRPCIPGTA